MDAITLIPIAIAITPEKTDHPMVSSIKAEVESLNGLILENRAMSAEFKKQTLARVSKPLSSDSFYVDCISQSKAFFLDTLRFFEFQFVSFLF